MTFLHAHTQHQALKQWLAAACEMASKTNMAMQQSKCTIRTHCHRAQQTHNSQQRFPVNKKNYIEHTFCKVTSANYFLIHVINDHHCASFKNDATQISQSMTGKNEKKKRERREQTIHLLLTKHIELIVHVGPLCQNMAVGLADDLLVVML